MKEHKGLFLTTTDTVTGIGGSVNENSFKALYALKNRSKDKPLIIMVSDIKEARLLEGWNEVAEEYAAKYWPGPLTLVLTDKTSVRIPGNKGLLKLLKLKGPCYVTSANISGEPTCPLEKAKEVFPEIDEVYDFGPGTGLPSKILDVRTGKVLR